MTRTASDDSADSLSAPAGGVQCRLAAAGPDRAESDWKSAALRPRPRPVHVSDDRGHRPRLLRLAGVLPGERPGQL